MRTLSRPIALGSVAALAIGCGDGTPAESGPAPELVSSVAVPDTLNVLSALVTIRTRHADSAAVFYIPTGGTVELRTPAVPLEVDSAAIPVFGLEAERGYRVQVTLWGNGRVVRGAETVVTTEALPEDLPAFTAGGPDPFPGFVAFQSGRFGIVIDNSGRVVWYHRFAEMPGLNFQPQANGRYVARPTAAGPGLWLEVDPRGRTTRQFGCAHGLQARFHDLIVEADGSYWTMCDDVRVMDLSVMGGRPDAQVIGTAVQHITSAGLQFEWSVFEHLNIAELEPSERAGANVNWTHGNALALDQDRNLLLSLRNLSEIIKIDTRTGALLWRMGGPANQFSVENESAPVYLRQHGLRLAGPRTFVVLDNLGNPGGSRAERYEFDETLRVTRLVGSLTTADGVVAQQGGTTQLLPEGRMLVAYGNGNRVEEYDDAGKLVWRIYGNPGYVYRAERIRSLYHPGLRLTR